MEGSFFGPSVIGKEAYEAQKALAEKTAGGYFGKAVIGETDYAGNVIEKKEAAPTTMSAADAVGTIQGNPDTIDRVLEAEFARPDGPRKGVLVAALKAEKAGQARTDVIDKLTAALG